MYSNPSMDSVRAQQLENWAEQREISSTNRHMYYEKHEESYETTISAYEEVSWHLFLHHYYCPKHCADMPVKHSDGRNLFPLCIL